MLEKTVGIMQRLREETLNEHKHAEGRPMEKALADGSLPRAAFVEHLGQRAVLHAALEQRLQELARKEPRVDGLFGDDQRQTPNLAADIEFLGGAKLRDPLPATRAAVDQINAIAAAGGPALLGVLYVFEGSKNGARYLAMRLRGVYRLTGADGMRYFDPHGERQRAVWEAFKQRFDALELSAEESNAIVAAAKTCFAIIASVDDAVFAATVA